jgi:hypothetical protein
MNGVAFDLSTPHGRMMVTIIAGIAEFERELIQERIRSGIATLRRRAAVHGGNSLGPSQGLRSRRFGVTSRGFDRHPEDTGLPSKCKRQRDKMLFSRIGDYIGGILNTSLSRRQHRFESGRGRQAFQSFIKVRPNSSPV